MDEAALAAEAAFLFRKLFGLAPEPALAQRYAEAHRQLGIEDSAETSELLLRIAHRDLDVEALEYVLRLRDRRNPLTRKVRILYYLAECDPRTLEHFSGSTANAAPGIARLGLRAALCFVRGRFLLWRHRLA